MPLQEDSLLLLFYSCHFSCWLGLDILQEWDASLCCLSAHWNKDAACWSSHPQKMWSSFLKLVISYNSLALSQTLFPNNERQVFLFIRQVGGGFTNDNGMHRILETWTYGAILRHFIWLSFPLWEMYITQWDIHFLSCPSRRTALRMGRGYDNSQHVYSGQIHTPTTPFLQPEWQRADEMLGILWRISGG